MALREFTDADGVAWQVWNVIPTLERRGIPLAGIALSPKATRGWLAFQSATDRRRLYDPPEGWDVLSDDELRTFCRAAMPVTTRAEHPPHPPPVSGA
ncbi:MAG: hypothetical protein KY444_04700 [Gemmatimonadetes bacterium]|nr:hypothetical protein [Gemmatimonadota bacterium]